MLSEYEFLKPGKIVKLHRMIHEYELYTSIQNHRPASSGEIVYFVSRCMEIKRRRNILLRDLR